ncbi:MAG: HEAT repeat domain-containing protein, partial [Nitrospirae bacterium]|nr:HEAT repeat domain-containing protein [Nitrospirota bacterium]
MTRRRRLGWCTGPPTFLPILAAALIVHLSSPHSAATPEIKDAADALIQLVDPEDPAARRAAAEWLGRTGEARFAKPLSSALRDSDPKVRAAVATALGQLPMDAALASLTRMFSSERAAEVLLAGLDALTRFKSEEVNLLLEDLILDTTAIEPVRAHAIEVYAKRAPPGAERFLDAARERLPDELDRVVERVLREQFEKPPPTSPEAQPKPSAGTSEEKPPTTPAAPPSPAPLPEPTQPTGPKLEMPELPPIPEVPEMPDAPRMRGRWLVVSSAAIYSASFMELMREASRSEVSPGWTYPIGLTVGGGTAYLLTHFSEGVPTGKAYWWGSSTIWGIGASHFAANGMEEDRAHVRRLYNLLGEGVGISVGAISAYRLDWGVGDTMFVNFGGMAGGIFGWGLEAMAGPGDHTAKASWLALGGTTTGLAAAALATSRVSVRSANVSRIFLGTGYGMWVGVWAPEMFRKDPPRTSRLGAAMVGASSGYLAGLVTNQYMRDAPTTSFRTAAWTGLGAQFGTGLGWFLYEDFDRASAALLESFSGAGLLIGSNYARIFPTTRRQPGFKSWVFLSAAYYGALAPLAFQGVPGRVAAPPPPAG